MKGQKRHGAGLCRLLALLMAWGIAAKGWTQEKARSAPENEFVTLGTAEGIGGEDFMKFDRGQIKYQIKTFIPPLMRPAFTGHAFVLPPNAFSIGIGSRFTTVDGNDFFSGGDPNQKVFGNSAVERKFLDLDLFYGFDLNRKYLHSFTLRLNIPYRDSRTRGFVHPNGQPFIDLLNSGSTQELGDIGVFLKKKVLDQGNAPFGFAVAGAVFFPTGSSSEKFGEGGYILMRRPDPDGDGVQPSFQQVIEMRGGPQNFFANVAAARNGEAWRVPAAMVEKAPRILTPFAFNNGIFGRFSPDGRLPSVLQPGTGSFSYLAGAFITRQFDPWNFGALGGFPGRSALHLGFLYKFNQRDGDTGIDPGDQITFFGSFVKPIYRDYLALDLSSVNFYQKRDHYPGKIPEPGIIADPETGERLFEFELVDRPSFSKGLFGLFSPSLVYSPDPQVRLVASGLFRVIDPSLGPAPRFVFRLGSDFIF